MLMNCELLFWNNVYYTSWFEIMYIMPLCLIAWCFLGQLFGSWELWVHFYSEYWVVPLFGLQTIYFRPIELVVRCPFVVPKGHWSIALFFLAEVLISLFWWNVYVWINWELKMELHFFIFPIKFIIFFWKQRITFILV